VAASPDLLRQVRLFEGLEPRELQSIAQSMKERTFAAGDTVTEEGAGGVGFFVIAEGEAEVEAQGEHRRDLGPGDHFGEVALVTGTDRTATIRAKTDLRCFGMTPWEFRPLVENNGKIAWKLLEQMGQMLRSSDR
jgi:CRP-like cAMP-binding protein